MTDAGGVGEATRDVAIRGPVRTVVLVAAGLALAAAAALVFERLGVPAAVIAAVAIALVGVGVAVAGIGGATMRLPVFLAAGRAVPATAAGLVLGASAVTAAGGTAAETALGLAVAAIVLAPALRAAGVPGLAGWLGHRFGDPMVRVFAALAVIAFALPAAAARLAELHALVALTLGWGAGANAVVLSLVCAAVLLPGGSAGLARAALSCALVAVVAAAVAAPAGALYGAAVSSFAAPVSFLAVATAALLPQTALAAAMCRTTEEARAAVIGAVVVALGLGIGLAAPAAAGGLFPALGQASLRLALDLAATLALLHAAGVALGYELRGPLDRRRHSTSKRFATLRAATLACIAAAAWLSTRDLAGLAAVQQTTAALLVAAVGPAVLLGVLVRRAGRWGGIFAAIGGLATAGLLLEGRLAPSIDAGGAALAGLVAGTVAGLIPTLLMRASTPPPPPVEDSLL